MSKPILLPSHRLERDISKSAILPPQQESAAERMELMQLVDERGLKVEDNRPKGGALWIIASDTNPRVTQVLTKWGFRYKIGKGWWKE